MAAGLDATVDPAVLDGLLRRAGREVDEGLLPACQVAVAHRGALLATRTYGAPPSSRFVVYSCTKAITAGALWLLLGDGRLTPGTRVADVVPAFAENHKGDVTVEHLLTHTAGFPGARMPDEDWADPRRRVERLASWRLEWEPGSRFVYHGGSAHWVLAHLAETVTGTDFRALVADTVLGPLGIPSLCLGPRPEDQHDVLDVVSVGEALSEAELGELGGSIGLDVSAIGTSEEELLRHNDPAVRAVGHPGGGAVGRAADLAMYYQALLANPDELWRPEVLRAGTAEIRCDLIDPMTGAPANRTLGLLLAGDGETAMLRGFASTNSGRTFGHMGAGGQVAWADPATGLSFAYVTNGLDRNPVRMGGRGVSLSYRAGAVVAAGG
ncbi:MAG: serine hydrolase domain-containing protein [Acidimicrobiales bacterium]